MAHRKAIETHNRAIQLHLYNGTLRDDITRRAWLDSDGVLHCAACDGVGSCPKEAIATFEYSTDQQCSADEVLPCVIVRRLRKDES